LAACVIDNIVPDYIWDESDQFDRNNYRQVIKEDGGDFRILQLTDMHIGSYLMDDFKAVNDTFDIVREAVKTAKPDMLVLTGDNVIATGVINTLWAERLIVFLDSFKIPYVLAMGNHDGSGFFDAKNNNRKLLTADVFASGKYSLFDKGPINIGGTGNYGVSIVRPNGELLYGVIVFDNGDNDFGAKQIKWYEWYVKNLSRSAYGTHEPDEGKVIKTIAVYHVPFPEVNNIRNELMNADPLLADQYFGESPTAHGTNSGMFIKMKELQSTAYMLFGHDHENALCYQYQGIFFVYGLKTGPCSGHEKNKQGTTLITLKDDLSVSVAFLQ
jgi:3',5'-cyclic AMP phosphodiesterase CpdA